MVRDNPRCFKEKSALRIAPESVRLAQRVLFAYPGYRKRLARKPCKQNLVCGNSPFVYFANVVGE